MANMTTGEAQNVINAYNIAPVANPANANQIRKDTATGDYAIAHAAEFGPCVNGLIANLRTLMTFLEKGRAMRFLSGDALRAVNDVFGLQLTSFPDASALRWGLAATKCVTLKTLAAPDKTRLRQYLALLAISMPGQTVLARVTTIVSLFVGNATNDVLAVLDAARLGNGNTTHVVPERMKSLIQMRNAYPTSIFPGFTQWGPGSAATPALNYEEHFLKHVCDSTNAYLMEAEWWWRALSIRVTTADLVPPPTQLELAYFPQGNSLDPRQIGPFITNVVRARVPLQQALFAAYGQAYSDYAFTLSRQLSNIMVESEGNDRVLVSGFTGHVTIFGRFASLQGALGLSSCYFVIPAQRAVKLDPNKTTKMWPMHR
jgi:hypothetical protein